MENWIAEHADLIFYGLLAGLALAEIVLRFILRVAKTSVALEYVDSGFIAVILALIIRTFVVQSFVIPSGSMEDTLLIKDHLLVNKFAYGTHLPFTDRYLWRRSGPKRGDIIVFKYPNDPRRIFVKRCIGLPGDVVEIKDKTLYLNGRTGDETYAIHRDAQIIPAGYNVPRDNFGPIIVPPDTYFMMGDNRDYSADSRFWGFLPRRLIEGRAFAIYWPVSRWRSIASRTQ